MLKCCSEFSQPSDVFKMMVTSALMVSVVLLRLTRRKLALSNVNFGLISPHHFLCLISYLGLVCSSVLESSLNLQNMKCIVLLCMCHFIFQ